MRVIYRPEGIENFHNCAPIRFNISGECCLDRGREVYIVSPRQAKRALKHYCGIPECGCPSGGVSLIAGSENEWGIPVEYCEEIGDQ